MKFGVFIDILIIIVFSYSLINNIFSKSNDCISMILSIVIIMLSIFHLIVVYLKKKFTPNNEKETSS